MRWVLKKLRLVRELAPPAVFCASSSTAASDIQRGLPFSSPPRLLQARKQNPKAFVFASRGKAKIQLARSADRDQRRMHGAGCRSGRAAAAWSW